MKLYIRFFCLIIIVLQLNELASASDRPVVRQLKPIQEVTSHRRHITHQPTCSMCKYSPAETSINSGSIDTQLIRLLWALQFFKQKAKLNATLKLTQDRPLKLGDQGEDVRNLKKILVYHGDLPQSDPINSAIFDESIDAALKRFQQRHFLSPDGVVGAKTKASLEMNYTKRCSMIEKNIRRLKTLNLDYPCIVVNIPTYHLNAVGNTNLFMPIVVGKSKKPTPVMTVKMDGVMVNPRWIVPPSIFKDKLNLLRDGTSEIKVKGYQVYDHEGRRVNPDTINWEMVDPQHAPYTLHQLPGPNNALGVMRFNLINSQAIHLHDTPKRQFFDCANRSFSSGCIRLYDYDQMLDWCLKHTQDQKNAKTMKERIKKLLHTKNTSFVEFSKPINVYFLYLTTWIDDNNQVWFSDPYSQD